MSTRRTLSVIAVCLIAASAALVGLTAPGPTLDRQHGRTASQAGHFVVHEWGTFTSFTGSDGGQLEFRPLVDADLPPFVLNRERQFGWPSLYSYPLTKSYLRVLVRMETPITYFYSDREREVSVRARFPQGLLTEYYPPVEHFRPEFNAFAGPVISGGELDWGKLRIMPDASGKPSPPDSDGYEHYAHARETDSALIAVERAPAKQRSAEATGQFYEKFLFYRGVGNFKLPLELTAHEGGQFELENTGRESIRSLFLVTIEGEKLRFVKLDSISGGKTASLVQSQQPSSIDELADAMTSALIDERLYEKEARAMVNTWLSSWFGEQGTRLLYLLPQKATDEVLPLEIQPQPEETVRVMVGRLEIMRPEDEVRINGLVKQSAHVRAQTAETYELPAAIRELGRLAEPALVRVKNLASDDEVRVEANLLLNQLQQYRNTLAAETSVKSSAK